LGITFIITGLMGIGFQSFGGMLTGDNEPPEGTEPTTVEKIEEKESIEEEVEDDVKAISYNNVINE
jgi:Na+-transporting NADH:ubiquinone oxidoreductase subunit E